MPCNRSDVRPADARAVRSGLGLQGLSASLRGRCQDATLVRLGTTISLVRAMLPQGSAGVSLGRAHRGRGIYASRVNNYADCVEPSILLSKSGQACSLLPSVADFFATSAEMSARVVDWQPDSPGRQLFWMRNRWLMLCAGIKSLVKIGVSDRRSDMLIQEEGV